MCVYACACREFDVKEKNEFKAFQAARSVCLCWHTQYSGDESKPLISLQVSVQRPLLTYCTYVAQTHSVQVAANTNTNTSLCGPGL